jgi:hypothetical protein
MMTDYSKAMNGMAIVVNGIKYSGFKEYYADGASEVWAINPGYATSSVKLLDTPMPGSLTAGTTGKTCSGA